MLLFIWYILFECIGMIFFVVKDWICFKVIGFLGILN